MNKLNFFKKTSLATIMGAIFLMSSVIPVKADNLQQQLNQSKKEANQLSGVLSTQKDKVSVATSQVLSLKQSVEALDNSIAREQAMLAEEQKHLKDLEDQQQKLEAERQEHIKSLGNYLKSNYEDGATTYLAVLFDATSVSDFIDRADKIQAIVGTYGKLQKKIATLNDSINTQKAEIKQNQNKIQSAIQSKQQTQQAIQQTLSKQQAILAQLTSQEKETLDSSLAAQGKVSRIQRLVQLQEAEASNAAKSNSSGWVSRGSSFRGGTVSVSGGASQILSYAARFLGTPYVWGGTTPSPGFDCSGYVQYVYGNCGISLGRTSEEQFGEGVSVSQSNLRPGDLVFFHTYSSGASHVGIYVGNNTMINSASGGVSYDDLTSSYWSSRYLGARRVLS